MKPNQLMRVALLLLTTIIAIFPVTLHAQTSANPANLPSRDGSHDFDFLIGNWKAHVRRLPDRAPEEGITVLTYSPADLARATAAGEFSQALHVAILMMAVLRGKLNLL